MQLRNVLPGVLLFAATLTARGQTVYAGEQTIDKQAYKGLFLTLPLAERQVESAWEAHIRQYGRVNSARGTYRVTSADIRDVSPEPIYLTSQVKGNKKSTTVFAAFDLGATNYVTPGNGNYSAAETLLKNFAEQTLYNDEVRGAEETFNEAQRNHQKVVRRGETLLKDIEANKKEKERLLRRIEENAKELEQLEKDVETNKVEQTNALTEMDNRRKNVEAVKAKKQ